MLCKYVRIYKNFGALVRQYILQYNKITWLPDIKLNDLNRKQQQINEEKVLRDHIKLRNLVLPYILKYNKMTNTVNRYPVQ